MSPRRRRWPWALAGALAIALVAAGLWAYSSRRAGTVSNRYAVHAVARYDDAVAAGDAARACQLLAPPAQAAIVTAARPYGRFTCRRLLSVAIAQLGPRGRKQIGGAAIRIVSSDADRARVIVSLGGGRKPTELWVLRVGSRWLVGSSVAGVSP